jgi:hypothetical protein
MVAPRKKCAVESEALLEKLQEREQPRYKMPERGWSAADAIIETKANPQVTKVPGKVTQLPVIRQVLSTLGRNPSVTLDRAVLVRAHAKNATIAAVERSARTTRMGPQADLEAAFAADTPAYIGPKGTKAAILDGELVDMLDNPELYEPQSPRLRDAVEAWDDANTQNLSTVRGEYGADVLPYSSGKPGSAYKPNRPTRESMEAAQEGVQKGYSSARVTGKTSVAKTRLYESARERMMHDPKFVPETNLESLMAAHDRGLANMAGNEAFRKGMGKTRLEAMQETHPKLAERMTGLRSRVQALQSNARNLQQRLDDRVDQFLADPDSVTLAELSESLDVRLQKGISEGADLKALNAEIQAVRQDIRALKPAWEGANLDPYVLNQKTYRYHTPEQSASIDRVLQTDPNYGAGLLDFIDEVRMTAFAGDTSPLTGIQLPIAMMSSPLNGVKALPNITRQLFKSGELDRIAAAEPDMVRRFNVASEQPFGEGGAEFYRQGKGLGRLPVLGPKIDAANRKMMEAVELMRYAIWKNDTKMAQRMNPRVAADVADADAANTLSAAIPALNPTDRGLSVLEAKLERGVVISPSFLGAPAKLMKDATSGLVKLGTSRNLSPAGRWQELAVREQLAIIRGTTLIGSLGTLSVASYMAAGKTPEEAIETAFGDNPRFLSLAIPGTDRYIPIGGPFRSFARAVYPKKIAGSPIPIPFAGLPQWAEGKIQPVISTTRDFARNKDYYGRAIIKGDFPENVLRGLWYGVESGMPLTAQAVSEAARTAEDLGRPGLETVKDVAIKAAGQFGGTDIREGSAYENRRELWERLYPDEEYSPSVYRRRAEHDERLRENMPEPSEERQSVEDLKAELEPEGAEIAAIMQRAPDGDSYQSAVEELQNWRAGYLSSIAGAQAIAYKDFPDSEDIFSQLAELRPADYRDPVTAKVDWDAYYGATDALLRQLPGDQRRDYEERARFLDPDLNRIDAAFRELRDSPDLDAYYDIDVETRTGTADRERLRLREPGLDATLFLLGQGTTSVLTRREQEKAQDMARDLLGVTIRVPMRGERPAREAAEVR